MKKTAQIILQNWRTLLYFEILYRSIGVFVVFPLCRGLMSLLLAASGASYLSLENLLRFVGRPGSILAVFLLLAVFAVYVYFEIAALMLCCEAGWNHNSLSLRELLKRAGRKSRRILHYRNLPLFLLLLPVIALSPIPLTSGVLQSFSLPGFIVEFLYGKPILFVFYITVMLVLNLILFFLLFGLPDVLLHENTLPGAWGASAGLLRRKKLRAAVLLSLYMLAAILAALAAAATVIVGIFLYARFFYAGYDSVMVFRSICVIWLRALSSISSAVFSVFLSAAVLVLYHRFRNDAAPEPEKESCSLRKPSAFGRALRELAGVFCALVVLGIFSESELGGNSYSSAASSTRIIAHRAGASFAPENTLAALETAIADGADMAEIDVRFTGDGVPIVIHDSGFKRTAGLNRRVRDLDIREVKALDAGSFFSEEYAGERIPTLEEMLLAAKGRIRLMIELKEEKEALQGADAKAAETAAQGTDAEAAVIELIRRCGMTDECIIISMNLELLKQVKELAPELENAYVSPVFYAEAAELDFVDGFSIETTSLTPLLSNRLQTQGKKVYAWTANSPADIRKILRCHTDGLLTDNVPLAQYYAEAGEYGTLVDTLTELFFPIAHFPQNSFYKLPEAP